LRKRGISIYSKRGSINMINRSMILAVQEFWQPELAVRLKSIFSVKKGKECG